MTLEEAIKHCEEVANDRAGCCEDCAEEHRQLACWLKELKQYREQTGGDLISRQALLQKMWNDFYKMEDEHEKEQGYEYVETKRCLEQNGFECAIKTVSEFPSAENTAEWIFVDNKKIIAKCSNCELLHDTEYGIKYCPNCGRRMLGVEE